MRLLTTSQDLQRYDAWVKTHPRGSLWQSLAWRTYQTALGRDVRIYVNADGDIRVSALVVIDRTSGGLSTWDIPRGPLWDDTVDADDVTTAMTAIMADAKADGCMSLYASPHTWTVHPEVSMMPKKRSGRHVYPEATRMIDLTMQPEEILQHMKPKGRYNIKVAEKHGVTVTPSQDIDAYYALAQQTGQRDGFTIHSKRHYATFLRSLPGAFLLLAQDTAKKPIAGLMGVIWDQQGIYYYGASDHASKALMAPYMLQWAGMQHCRAQGCTSYDLLGVAPPEAGADHPWHGITAFKEKFGGTLITYPPEREIVLRPWIRRGLMIKRRLVG